MDRYGSPHFRGGVKQGYGQRRSGAAPRSLLGAGPPRSSGPHISAPQGPLQNVRPTARGGRQSVGLLGSSPRQMLHGSYRDGGNDSWNDPNVKPRSHRMPEEVTQLMKSLGLSQADMKKLSQLPDSELSVDNIARAIGNLKKQSQHYSHDDQDSNMYDPSHPTDDRDSYFEELPRYSNEPSQYEKSDMLGTSYTGHFQQGRSYDQEQSLSTPRSGPKSVGSFISQRNQRDSSYYNSRSSFGHNEQEDYYQQEDTSYHREPSEQYKRGTSDAYSRPKRIVEEIPDDRQPPRQVTYNRPKRLETNKVQSSQRPTPRGLLQAPGEQGNNRTLLDRDSHRPNRPTWEQNVPQQPSGSGLLGNPLQPNARGLESLAAAVGRQSNSTALSVKQAAAATVLNPLLLGGQNDPAMLEVQLQAIKVLQAEAFKQRQAPALLDQPVAPMARRETRPRQRSPRSDRMDRRQENIRNDAKLEADEMRANQGRVLYMRFRSQKIDESDLRQLATAFGRVTNILIIRTKIPNGFNQAFMEMEQSDCAAAMLERYKARPPTVLGCQVLVDRSNYKDLHLRNQQQQDRKRKISTSMSPIRSGTTQFPSKRPRDGPRISISVSDNKRQVSQSGESPRVSRDDKKSESVRLSERSQNRDRRKDSLSKDANGKNGKDRKQDSDAKSSEEQRNRRRATERRRSNDRRSNERKTSTEKETVAKSSSVDVEEQTSSKDEEKAKDNEEKRRSLTESEKNVDEPDPLDVIANELALHDEFVLMDEVGYEQEMKSRLDKEESSEAAKNDEEDMNTTKDDVSDHLEEEEKDTSLDLEVDDIDLVNTNIDAGQADEDGESGADVELEGEAENDAEAKRVDHTPNENDEDEETRENRMEQHDEGIDNLEDAGEVLETEALDTDDKKATVVLESQVAAESNSEPTCPAADVAVKDEEVRDEEQEDVAVENGQIDAEQKERSNATETDEDGGHMARIKSDADVLTEPDTVTTDDSLMEEESTEDTPVQDDQYPGEEDDEASSDQADEVARLKYIISSALQEVESAKVQLAALNKTTKNRATVAVSKKLKLCLDGAASRLQSADKTDVV